MVWAELEWAAIEGGEEVFCEGEFCHIGRRHLVVIGVS